MIPHPNQPYPYDPQSHTFLSPAGLFYPAPHPSPGSGHVHAASIAVPRYPNGQGTRHVSHPSLAWGVPMTGQPGGPLIHSTPSDYRDQAFGRGHSHSASIAATVLRNPLAGSLSPGHDVPTSRAASHLIPPTVGLASRAPPPRDTLGSTYGEGRSPSSLSPAFLASPIGLASRSTSDLTNLRVPSPSLSISTHSEPTALDPSRSGPRWSSLPQRPERPLKPRTGGPPKAVLGGPGGKTFDEMASASASASASPVARRSSDDKEQAKPGSESPQKSQIGGEAKGKMVTVRLPPERYSPPDSPVGFPTREEGSADDSDDPETHEESSLHLRQPRRDAFPWPAHRIRLSATGTPLPPSPPAHDHAEDREGSLPSSDLSEATESGESPRRVKDTRVNLPDEMGWERLLPSRLPAGSPDHTPTELKAAEDRIDPDDGTDSSSFELEPEQSEPRSRETSPVLNDPLEHHADDVDVIHTETIWDSSTTAHVTSSSHLQDISASTSSPPNQPITPPPQDDVPAALQAPLHPDTLRDQVSPTSHGSGVAGPSPTKPSFSGLDNGGFLKRQLGGLLRDPRANHVQRKRHASDGGDGGQSILEETVGETAGQSDSRTLEDEDERFVDVPLTAPVVDTASEVDDPDKTLVDDSSHPAHVNADSKAAPPHSVALDLAVETGGRIDDRSVKEDRSLEISKAEPDSASRGRAQRATVGPKLGRFLQGQLQGFLRPAEDRNARKTSMAAEDASVLGTKRSRDDHGVEDLPRGTDNNAPIVTPQPADSVPVTPKPKHLLPHQSPKSKQPASTSDHTPPAELTSSIPPVADSPASRLHALGPDVISNEIRGSRQSADLPASQRSISSSVLGLTTFHTKLRAGAASFQPSGVGSASTSTTSSPIKSVSAPHLHASQPSLNHTISPGESTKPSGLRATAMDFQPSTHSHSSSTSLSSPIKLGFALSPSGTLVSTPNLDNGPHKRLRPTATSFVPTNAGHNSRASLASSVLEDSVMQFTQRGSGDFTFSPPRNAAVPPGIDSPQKRLRPSATPFRPPSHRAATSTPRTSVAEMFSSPGYGGTPRSAEAASESEDGVRKRLRPTAQPFAPVFGIDFSGTTGPNPTVQSAKDVRANSPESIQPRRTPVPQKDGSSLRPSAAAFVPSAPFTFSFESPVPPIPASEPGYAAGQAFTFLGRTAVVVEPTSGSPHIPPPATLLLPIATVMQGEEDSIPAPTDPDQREDSDRDQQHILVDPASETTISQATPPTSDGLHPSGLFFRSPAGTPSSISPDAGLAVVPIRGEASPRLPPGEETWKGIKDPPTKSTLSHPSNRASREDRQSPKRKAENSHLPSLFASIPRGPTPCEQDLAEVTIHHSQPIHSPHATLSIGASPSREAEVELGPAKASDSESDGAVDVDSADVDDNYGTDANRIVADDMECQPNAGDVANVPAVSTTTAVPSQIDQPSSLNPLACPFSSARSIVRASRVSDLSLIAEAHFRAQENAFQPIEHDETKLSPDSTGQVLATLPLATPSGGGTSPVSIPVFTQPVIQVDEAADNRRFRAWVFPSGPSHSSRPSLSRRYSAPNDGAKPEDEVAEPNRHKTSLGVGVAVGVASTYLDSPAITDDDKSGQLSLVEHDLEPSPSVSAGAQTDYGSVQASVEFPLRRTKTLAIVNDSPSLSASSFVPSATLALPGDDALESSPFAQKVDQILRVVEETLVRTQEAERYPQNVAETVAGKVREDIVAGQAVVIAAFRETAEADHSAILEPSLNHIASILEAHSQLLSNIQAGNELVSSEADSVNSRLQEMFASLLTGQHTMLDMFSELSETGDASRDELRGAILALRDLQTTVQRRSTESEEAHRALDAAQQELKGSKGGLREARTESEVLKQRLADVRAERDELRVGREDGVRRLEAREQGERIAVERADHLKAMRMAAEDERDALAVALQRASGRVDTQEEKLRVLQSELEREREKAAAIPVVDVHAERLAEMELSSKTFQEEMLQRLGRLDESMHESMGSRVKEYESVLDRNRLLHGEMDLLRQKLDSTTDQLQALQLSSTTTLASSEREQAALADQLSAERAGREDADRRIQELEQSLARVSEEKVDWQMIATERQAAARMSEIRVHALSQENVYWRQFALSYDRKQFSRFMSANPGLAVGGTGTTQMDNPEGLPKESGKLSAGSPTPGISNGADGGGAVNGLKRMEAEEGGTWWNVAK